MPKKRFVKSNCVTIRMEPRDRKKLERRAIFARMSLAEYIRWRLNIQAATEGPGEYGNG